MIVSDHRLSNKSMQGHKVIKCLNCNEIFQFIFVVNKKMPQNQSHIGKNRIY